MNIQNLNVQTIVFTLFLGLGPIASPAHAEARDAGPPFGMLELIDEVIVGEDLGHEFSESAPGVSEVQTLLGSDARVLPNVGGPRHFAYRIGKDKGLVAGQAYMLEVAFPEDEPRTVFLLNRGAETSRGFSTGTALGDATTGYAVTSLESLDFPLSGETKTYRQLFWLHDRFEDVQRTARSDTPEDGFWVIIAQPGAWQGSATAQRQAPLSHGAAISAIRLYAVDDPSALSVTINYPPDDLPRRHIFFREEMSDDVINSLDETVRGVVNETDWYEYKARLMDFLGINTFSKDLLEFGANQGWDSTAYGGNDWVHQSSYPQRWANIIEMLTEYDHYVLPYYEYAGSKGDNGLGYQVLARPLWRDRYSGFSSAVPCEGYTHIWWGERANADLTDPDTYEDLRKMLELTIVDHKDKVTFVGAWLRTRPSDLPVSFADEPLQRYSDEMLAGEPATREALREDATKLAAYRDWWGLKRRDFLTSLHAYLEDNLEGEQAMLFTAYSEEGGPWVGGGIVTDDPTRFEPSGMSAQDFDTYMAEDKYLSQMLADQGNWNEDGCTDPSKRMYEWQHSAPRPDPQNYEDTPGAMMTFPFSSQFTVASQVALDTFRTPSGLAIIRHFNLNENTMTDSSDSSGTSVGYFVADVDRAGAFSMLAEAKALAHGDPRYIGYLAGSSFSRGFPVPTRAFNAAFLALPAIPSEILTGAASDAEVIVRAYPSESHGTFSAIVNTGMGAKRDVVITLPDSGVTATDRVGMTPLTIEDGTLKFDLEVAGVHVVQLEPGLGGDSDEPGTEMPQDESPTVTDATVYEDPKSNACGPCSSVASSHQPAGLFAWILTFIAFRRRRHHGPTTTD